VPFVPFEPPAGRTLLRPQRSGRSSSETPHGLPADLVSEAGRRLRILAILYAFVFFMAGFFPALIRAEDRAILFGRPIQWVPGGTAIGMSLLVALVLRVADLSPRGILNLALVFEVVSSYGIAAAEYLDPHMDHHFMGLSWVAVWTLLFNVVVPTAPRRALIASLAAVSAVPAMIGYVVSQPGSPQKVPGIVFFFAYVFPYLLVVLMAYVGARLIYALGAEIARARELGSYKLIERLGAGGMGEVWRAQHRMLARPAAIKLIHPSLTTDAQGGASVDARRRFEREAQAIASLRSPHTVTLFDFGVTDEGAFYYVMEMLDGLDAESLVKRFGQLAPERAVNVIRQVCHSLSEAHAAGLVHRDVKPANIFLCRYGEEYDFAKVLDFGLVKAVDTIADAAPTMTMTREHSVHGTPAFIAPEQALNLPTLDHRVDIYATGCVAYWLLTGQLVFTGDTPMALLMQHTQSPPPPMSSRTELPIPPALERIVMACLAKDPADRPQSARELADALGAVEIAGAWTPDRARAWWSAHRPASAHDDAPATS
jgi:serine/threonine-protein kinase